MQICKHFKNKVCLHTTYFISKQIDSIKLADAKNWMRYSNFYLVGNAYFCSPRQLTVKFVQEILINSLR